MDTKGLSGAETLLRVLRGMGVEWIFASPGSEWAPVWEFLAKPYGSDKDIPAYVSSRHEEVAVGMASGYAKATGKLPAVMIHTTVGSLHATMALRGAMHERIPMVVLTGESIGFGEEPGQDPGQQWLGLLSDIGGPARLVERCVKWSFGLNSPALLPGTIQRACQLAMAAPQGPVFVSVPMEFLFATMTSSAPPSATSMRAATAPADAIDELARALVDAANPVIVTEDSGRTVRGVDLLVELAELLGAPVVEGWHPGYVNFPRRHPLYGGIGPSPSYTTYLKEADLAFLVAASAPWHPPSAGPGPNTRVAVLGEEPLRADLPFWGFRSDLIVTGDVESSLALLIDRVKALVPTASRASRVDRWRARHDQARKTQRDEARATGKHAVIDTRWVAHELDEVIPDDAIVVDETITHRLALHRGLESLTPGRFFEASCGGLGTGLGEALGVKAAAPERPVIALIGDGTFNYNPVTAALGASQEHRLPILIVIFNNSGYLSQKSGIPRHYPDGFAVKAQKFAGTSITPNPDYAMLARAFDGVGETVERPSDVRAALSRGLDAVRAGRLAIVDVRLEPINPGGEVR